MDVRRLAKIVADKVETVRTFPKHRWHRSTTSGSLIETQGGLFHTERVVQKRRGKSCRMAESGSLHRPDQFKRARTGFVDPGAGQDLAVQIGLNWRSQRPGTVVTCIPRVFRGQPARLVIDPGKNAIRG